MSLKNVIKIPRHALCVSGYKNEEEVKGQGELPAYHVYFDKMHFFI